MRDVTIGVVAPASMGHDVAHDFASSGYPVVLQDIDEGRLARTRDLTLENVDDRAAMRHGR